MLACANHICNFSHSRDRELQIATIEQTTSNHHHFSERDAGKSYLLETYLNGIHPNNVENNHHDPIIAKETTTGNSDSGVHTEDATTTPELGISPTHNTDADNEDADNNNAPHDLIGKQQFLKRKKATTEMAPQSTSKRNQHHRHHHTKRKHHTTSKRETKLLKDHECSKEFLASINVASSSGTADVSDNDGCSSNDECDCKDDNNCVRHQVMAMQKLVVVNKHLQREEELLVRLMAKVRKYECDMPDMSAVQIRTAIEQVNRNITCTGAELHRMEMEMENFGELLSVKSDVVNRLSHELEQLEIDENVCGDATAMATTRYRLPDDVILRQAPLYFQKDDCGIAAINLHCDQRNANKFAATGMDNAKVGPKKLLNEFCKDQELLTYDSALLGTLV